MSDSEARFLPKSSGFESPFQADRQVEESLDSTNALPRSGTHKTSRVAEQIGRFCVTKSRSLGSRWS